MEHFSTMSLVSLSLLLFVIGETIATFTEQSGYHEEKDKELENFITHLKYLASNQSTSKDRADLIRGGFSKSAENFRYPIHSKPLSASNEFDCKIRKLAFAFSKKISPGKGVSEMKAIFDGLELGSYCNVTFKPTGIRNENTDNNDGGGAFTVEIFVDQANGKNNHDGSFLEPMLDIQSGVNLCRKKRSNNIVACKVLIRGGVYHVRQPITIKDDNIMILAYHGENVRISSDVIVEPSWMLYKSSMEAYKGLNPLFEGIKPNQTTKNIIFIGVVKNSVVCEQKCASMSKCTAFSFFDKTTKDFINHCYIRIDGKWNTLLTTGVISGKKVCFYSIL